eukprot:6534126-Alexandrium_andersonii.AAC.1
MRREGLLPQSAQCRSAPCRPCPGRACPFFRRRFRGLRPRGSPSRCRVGLRPGRASGGGGASPSGRGC